jgi:hypothetical protein
MEQAVAATPAIYHRTELGEAVLANGSKILTHCMKLVLAMVDGRTPSNALKAALPQAGDIDAAVEALCEHGFIELATAPRARKPLANQAAFAATEFVHAPDSRMNWQSTLALSNTQIQKLHHRNGP